MVNNHGDRKSPKDRVVGPLPNGHSWLINGGDPNHLLTGMILQVGILAHRTPDDEQGVYFFTSEKGKVFRFHETILRR